MTTPFGKAVRHLRERKGVSQKEMAKALGELGVREAGLAGFFGFVSSSS